MTNDFQYGTLTFLFTDLEGSTRLWETHPQAMKPALALHDHLLRAAIAAHGGRIINPTGDGLVAVFAHAPDGAAASLACQEALISESWAGLPGPLRVRMSLHSGAAELRDGDYFGPSLNRAARLMSIASGGQILLSAAAAELVRDQLPENALLQDLGEVRLKDLTRSEHVYQLTHSELPSDFPPLKSLDAYPNNLPVQLSSFVGHEREIHEVEARLMSTHLLTLTGPGGTGKSRLSLQAGAELLDQFADGVWLVELAPLTDPDLIAQAAASALNVREPQGRSLLDALTDYLRYKQLLLILDNCEHLLEACSRFVHHLLSSCPKLKILASSRESLGIEGETTFRVPSLSLPGTEPPTQKSLENSESSRLFIERARSHVHGFALNEQNAPAIAQICLRLDGIPLALELAAARLKLLSVEQIAARLDDRFRLLTGGSRTALPRQQTLRALIDWSWELLSVPERILLRRLSVFAGGWSLDTAEVICAFPSSSPHPDTALDVLDLLAQLVNKSLVVVETGDSPEPRYRLLETIRQYGREKLVEAGDASTATGEATQIRDRHLDYFLALSEAAEAGLKGPQMIAWLNRLETEQDNLRVAMEWAFEHNPIAALRMLGATYIFWGRRASATEGIAWVKRALERAEQAYLVEASTDPAYQSARARALTANGMLTFQLGDNLAARDLLGEAIRLARELNDTQTLASALGIGATVCGLMGDVEHAGPWSQEALELSRDHGYAYEESLVAGAEMFLAVATSQPVPAGAAERSIRAARISGNPWSMAMAISNFAMTSLMIGDLDQAYTNSKEAARLFKEIGDRYMYTAERADQGHVLRQKGHLYEALAVYRETIHLWQELGQHAAIAHELECIAFIAFTLGRNGEAVCLEEAARLLGAAEALRESIHSSMTPMERREYETTLVELRAAINPAAFERAWAEGRGLSMEQAVEDSLAIAAPLTLQVAA